MGGDVGPKAGLDVATKRKFLPCMESNPDRPARSLITKLAELSRLHIQAYDMLVPYAECKILRFTLRFRFLFFYTDRHPVQYGYLWLYKKRSCKLPFPRTSFHIHNIIKYFTWNFWEFRELGGAIAKAARLASNRGDPGLIPGGFKWDSCWTKSHCCGVFSKFFRFPLLIIIPPFLHIYLSPLHEVCDSSDQAARYHILGPKLGASFLTRHFAGLGIKAVYF
jgi:hypothetical protein